MTRRFRGGWPTHKWLASLTAATALMAMGSFSIEAQAASEDSRHVKASLVAETQNIVAGQPLRLALRQQIEPGWHTYWSNPGESGLPTTLHRPLPQPPKERALARPPPQPIRHS